MPALEEFEEETAQNNNAPAATETADNDSDNGKGEDAGGEEEYYVVEKILEEHRSEEDGSTWYKIRWQGYGSDDDTLEPATELEHCVDILADWERRKTEAQEKNGRHSKFPGVNVCSEETLEVSKKFGRLCECRRTRYEAGWE